MGGPHTIRTHIYSITFKEIVTKSGNISHINSKYIFTILL